MSRRRAPSTALVAEEEPPPLSWSRRRWGQSCPRTRTAFGAPQTLDLLQIMIFIRNIHPTKEKAQLLLFGIVAHVDEEGEEPIGVSLNLRNVTKVLFDPCNGWRNVIVHGRNMKEYYQKKRASFIPWHWVYWFIHEKVCREQVQFRLIDANLKNHLLAHGGIHPLQLFKFVRVTGLQAVLPFVASVNSFVYLSQNNQKQNCHYRKCSLSTAISFWANSLATAPSWFSFFCA